MTELNPAEQAAAEALADRENDEFRRDHGCRDGKHSDGTDCIYGNGNATAADYADEARAVVAAVHDIIAHEVLTDASERVFAEGRSKRDAVMAGKSTTSLEYIEGFEDAAERVGLYADRDRAERQAEGDGAS